MRLYCIILACLTLHCSKSKDDSEELKARILDASTVKKNEDATPRYVPTQSDALQRLNDFAELLAAEKYQDAASFLWNQGGLGPQDLERFLRRLAVNNHIDFGQAESWSTLEFGPIRSRFGSLTDGIVKHHGLSEQEVFALGGESGGAVFAQADKVLFIVAVHQLGSPPADE